MQLVSELQATTNSEAHTNDMQLHAIQEQFASYTKTNWIHGGTLDNANNLLWLYKTLQEIRLPHWSANKSVWSLFYAISPMATKGWYLVHYLPQYGGQVCMAIAQLSDQLPIRTIAPIAMLPQGQSILTQQPMLHQ